MTKKKKSLAAQAAAARRLKRQERAARLGAARNFLAVKVREERKRQGLTQADLAGISGVGRRTLQRLERSEGRADLPAIVELAKALAMQPSELLP